MRAKIAARVRREPRPRPGPGPTSAKRLAATCPAARAGRLPGRAAERPDARGRKLAGIGSHRPPRPATGSSTSQLTDPVCSGSGFPIGDGDADGVLHAHQEFDDGQAHGLFLLSRESGTFAFLLPIEVNRHVVGRQVPAPKVNGPLVEAKVISERMPLSFSRIGRFNSDSPQRLRELKLLRRPFAGELVAPLFTPTKGTHCPNVRKGLVISCRRRVCHPA